MAQITLVEAINLALARAMEGQAAEYSAVLVDDGSTDGTWEAAVKRAGSEPRLKVLRHRANSGKTEAMLTGSEAASGDVIVLYDADMQHSVRLRIRHTDRSLLRLRSDLLSPAGGQGSALASVG